MDSPAAFESRAQSANGSSRYSRPSALGRNATVISSDSSAESGRWNSLPRSSLSSQVVDDPFQFATFLHRRQPNPTIVIWSSNKPPLVTFRQFDLLRSSIDSVFQYVQTAQFCVTLCRLSLQTRLEIDHRKIGTIDIHGFGIDWCESCNGLLLG